MSEAQPADLAGVDEAYRRDGYVACDGLLGAPRPSRGGYGERRRRAIEARGAASR